MSYTCGTCGTTTTEKISPTYDHTYDDGVVGVPQTCVTTGTMIYTCTGCGTTKTSYLEATNEHVLSEVQVIKEPTCTSYGQSAQQCGTCGQYFNVAFIDPVDHDYDDGVAQSELKCGSVVEMLYTCKSCGNEKTSSEYISHVYDEGYVSTEPTCTAKGKTTYTCELCGKTKTVADIAALGHSEVEDAAEAPTCTETGLTTGSHCERCDVVITAQAEVSATGHSYSSSIVAPTCTTGGYTEHICDVCGNTYQDTATSSLGHTWDEGTVTTAPKCESAGAMTYTCKTCGNTKVEAVEATGHSYGKTVTAPTCEGQGFTTYTCAGCRDSYKSDYVDKLGHKYDGGKTTKNATCTETGIETYTCTACGAFYTQELPALGHEAVSDAASTPTCEDFGLTEGSHCSRCETVLEDQETVEATGHTWNEGVVTKAATTEETGIMTYTCSVCGDTKEESIPCIEEAAFLRGDVDENGTVDIIDCVRIVRYIAGYNVKINLNAADMTGDGSINTFDVVRLMKYIAGYDV